MIKKILEGFQTSLGKLPGEHLLLTRVPSTLAGTSLWVELMKIPKYQSVFGTPFGTPMMDDVAQGYARKPCFVFGVYVAAPTVENIYPYLDPAGPMSINQRLEMDLRADENLYGPVEAQVVVQEAHMLQEWQQVKTMGSRAYATNFPMGVIMVAFL